MCGGRTARFTGIEQIMERESCRADDGSFAAQARWAQDQVAERAMSSRFGNCSRIIGETRLHASLIGPSMTTASASRPQTTFARPTPRYRQVWARASPADLSPAIAS